MIQDREQLKQWFKRYMYPTQQQFWDWIDSFWHKNEAIPASSIEGLQEVVDGVTAGIGDVLNEKQNIHDESLDTDSKEIVPAINEIFAGLSNIQVDGSGHVVANNGTLELENPESFIKYFEGEWGNTSKRWLDASPSSFNLRGVTSSDNYAYFSVQDGLLQLSKMIPASGGQTYDACNEVFRAENGHLQVQKLFPWGSTYTTFDVGYYGGGDLTLTKLTQYNGNNIHTDDIMRVRDGEFKLVKTYMSGNYPSSFNYLTAQDGEFAIKKRLPICDSNYDIFRLNNDYLECNSAFDPQAYSAQYFHVNKQGSMSVRGAYPYPGGVNTYSTLEVSNNYGINVNKVVSQQGSDFYAATILSANIIGDLGYSYNNNFRVGGVYNSSSGYMGKYAADLLYVAGDDSYSDYYLSSSYVLKYNGNQAYSFNPLYLSYNSLATDFSINDALLDSNGEPLSIKALRANRREGLEHQDFDYNNNSYYLRFAVNNNRLVFGAKDANSNIYEFLRVDNDNQNNSSGLILAQSNSNSPHNPALIIDTNSPRIEYKAWDSNYGNSFNVMDLYSGRFGTYYHDYTSGYTHETMAVHNGNFYLKNVGNYTFQVNDGNIQAYSGGNSYFQINPGSVQASVSNNAYLKINPGLFQMASDFYGYFKSYVSIAPGHFDLQSFDSKNGSMYSIFSTHNGEIYNRAVDESNGNIYEFFRALSYNDGRSAGLILSQTNEDSNHDSAFTIKTDSAGITANWWDLQSGVSRNYLQIYDGRIELSGKNYNTGNTNICLEASNDNFKIYSENRVAFSVHESSITGYNNDKIYFECHPDFFNLKNENGNAVLAVNSQNLTLKNSAGNDFFKLGTPYGASTMEFFNLDGSIAMRVTNTVLDFGDFAHIYNDKAMFSGSIISGSDEVDDMHVSDGKTQIFVDGTDLKVKVNIGGVMYGATLANLNVI